MSQNDTLKKLTQAQRKGLLALISGSNQVDAAAVAGVSKRTMQRWASLPAFQAAMASSVDISVSIAVSRLSSLTDLAIDVLQMAMIAESSTTSQRLRAAEATLKNVLHLAELNHVLGRLDELEARIERIGASTANDSGLEG